MSTTLFGKVVREGIIEDENKDWRNYNLDQIQSGIPNVGDEVLFDIDRRLVGNYLS